MMLTKTLLNGSYCFCNCHGPLPGMPCINGWENFACKTELSWWIFALAGSPHIGHFIANSEVGKAGRLQEPSRGFRYE